VPAGATPRPNSSDYLSSGSLGHAWPPKWHHGKHAAPGSCGPNARTNGNGPFKLTSEADRKRVSAVG
jgi:hypothetical protein